MVGRVFVLLMDSFGIGASLDAETYGDTGANTFGHIVRACQQGVGDLAGVRSGPLRIPQLADLGLYWALLSSSGQRFGESSDYPTPQGMWGYAVETSLGKDTPSGHWELMGVPVTFEWGYFPDQPHCFPKPLIDALIKEANLPGVLGEQHASGTVILETFGATHQATGQPIVYTSADSVFQIAAHEESFGLDRLYEVCEIARRLVDEYHIGRVIARPFVGVPGAYHRTGNRRDYSVPPPAPTLFDDLKAAGREVIAIGKTADIFAHQGMTQTLKADGNLALFDATIDALKTAPAGSLTFTNFVDFDSVYGHRRDIPGYAHALEQFDTRLQTFRQQMQPGDWGVIVADHGCDPTWAGSDHTREHIPVLVFGPEVAGHWIGRRESFADVGQSIAAHLGIAPLRHGISFIE